MQCLDKRFGLVPVLPARTRATAHLNDNVVGVKAGSARFEREDNNSHLGRVTTTPFLVVRDALNAMSPD